VFRFISAVVAATLVVGCTGSNRASQGPVTLTYQDQDSRHSQEILDRSNRAIARIGEFWGVDFDRPIKINVDPRVNRSTAFYAEKFINMSSVEVAYFSSVIEHEIAHLVVDRDGLGRPFMNEGIAVYCEMLFKDATNATEEQLVQRIDQPARNAIQRTGYLRLAGTDEAIDDRAGRYFSKRLTAYFEAASFTKYVITAYGLDKFKKAYRGRAFDAVYGKSLGMLESEWLDATFPELGGRRLLDGITIEVKATTTDKRPNAGSAATGSD
jgi:hypothetical protein